MQRQRTTVESIPEAFEFELGSTSSNSVIVEPQVYWNDMLNNQNVVDYFLSPTEVEAPYANAANPNTGGMGSWNFSGPSSSGYSIENPNGRSEAKMDHPCTSSLSPGLREGRIIDGSMPLPENVDINLGSNGNTSEQVPSTNLGSDILQNSYASGVFQNSNHNAGFDGSDRLALGVGIYSEARASGSEVGHLPPGNNSEISHGNSTGGIVTGDADGRPSSSFNGRRLSCKRKDIGVPGHCSDGASSSYHEQSESSSMQVPSSPPHLATGLSISRSSDNLSIATRNNEAMNPRVSTRMNGVGLECYNSRLTESADSSHRNVRRRIDSAGYQDLSIPNSQQASSSLRHRNAWPQPPSLPTSFIQTGPAAGNANFQAQSHAPVIPGLPWCPFSWNARSAGPSPSPVILGERFISPGEETNSRSLTRAVTPEPAVFIPANPVQFGQDPTNWTLSSGSVSLHGGAASSQASGPSTDPSSNLLPPRNASSQYQLNLELVRRSIASAGSSYAGQGSYNQSRGGHSASLQTVASSRGVRIRSQQHPLLRSLALLDRQNDAITGDSPSQRMAAVRERRSRLISEIRNVLGLLRRGEDVRFEELILDQAVLLGAADLHDRHRDMRLDVDNMSYEELLALEERIGNVSTGLSEESISKCLKQWKYSPPLAESSPEVEPCCICQEDYVEGEDMGTLGCGHEFHTTCIKQWLQQKNLCPICKASALVT